MRKIETALLSYGLSGKVFHAPFIAFHDGFELMGSWERSKKLIQEDYPATSSYASYEELLATDVDLVIVNTPVVTHYEYAKKALLAGKHLIVEKAFTSTIAQAEELVALAKAKNLKLAVFQNRRWDSDFKTVQNIINDGNLGALVDVEFRFERYNPMLSPKLHKETATAGAGIVKDLGPHLIDQALCLFGLPKSVCASIRNTRANSLVDDWFDMTLYYPTFQVRLKASFFVREPAPAYVLHGTKGSFLKTRADVQEEQLKKGLKPNLDDWGNEPTEQSGLLHTEVNGKIIKEKVNSLPGNYYDFFEGVYQSIVNNTMEPVTGFDGLKVMQIIEAALQSNQQKKVIDLC
jgi:predicted dehydrogenase